MKPRTMFLAIGVLSLLVAGAVALRWHGISERRQVRMAMMLPPSPSVPFGGYHQQRVTFWRTFPRKGRVVMIGDSLTEQGHWSAILPEFMPVDRGVSGDTTEAILSRLDTVDAVKAETAVLMAGTNDVLQQATSIDGTMRNWSSIVEHLTQQRMRVVAMSTPLTSIPAANEHIRELNARIVRECETGRCTYVDLNARIAADGAIKPEATWDGVHLTLAAYREWADLLRPLLAEHQH